MGQSTNAILAFGFDMGEELPQAFVDEDGEGFDFSEWAEKQAGMMYKPEDKGYFKRRDAMLAALPVSVVEHCSGEYPMYFLAMQGSTNVARRGFPEVVSISQPSIEQIDAMQLFCEKHGIEWQEPRWHIFSMWS